jgi:hypothetical protein
MPRRRYSLIAIVVGGSDTDVGTATGACRTALCGSIKEATHRTSRVKYPRSRALVINLFKIWCEFLVSDQAAIVDVQCPIRPFLRIIQRFLLI